MSKTIAKRPRRRSSSINRTEFWMQDPEPQDSAFLYFRRAPYWLSLMLLGWVWARFVTDAGAFTIFPLTAGLDPMIRAGYSASFLCYFASRFGSGVPRPRSGELIAVGLLALLLEFYIFTNRPYTWDLALRFQCMGIGLGVAGMIALLFLTCTAARGEMRARYLAYFSISAFLPLYPKVTSAAQDLIGQWTPLVYDFRAYQLDMIFGTQPSLTLARAGVTWGMLGNYLGAVYGSLPLVLVLTILFCIRHAGRSYFDSLSAIVLGGGLGVALYPIYPAINPRFLYGYSGLSFPPMENLVLPPQLPPLVVAPPELLRNCAPSLHFAWALICFFALRRISRPLAGAAALFLVSTAAATMSTGEHYWGDLVISCPFTLALLGLFARPSAANGKARILCCVLGGTACVGLLLAQRLLPEFLIQYYPLTRVVQGAAVLLTFWGETRLAKLSMAPSPS